MLSLMEFAAARDARRYFLFTLPLRKNGAKARMLIDAIFFIYYIMPG